MKTSDFQIIVRKDDWDNGYFSWMGCENEDCPEHGKGATVIECLGWKTLEKLQDDSEGNAHEFQLCLDCFYFTEFGPASGR